MIYFVSQETVKGIPSAKMSDCIEFMSSTRVIGLDTETIGLRPFGGQLLSIQVGNADDQFVIDVRFVTDRERKKLCQEILTRHYFDGHSDNRFNVNSVGFVTLGHNFKFDYQFLRHNGYNINGVIDTYVNEQLIRSGHPHKKGAMTLETLAEKYAGVKLDKTIRGHLATEGFTPRTIKYAAEDVMVLPAVFNKQKEIIQNWNLEFVADKEALFTRVLANMEYNGVLVDTVKWKAVAESVLRDLREAEINLDSIVYSEPALQDFIKNEYQMDMFAETRTVGVNWNSPDQKMAVVNALGFHPKSTEVPELLKLKNRHPIFQALIDYSSSQKMKSSFGYEFLSFINPVTGRIHPDYHQMVSTGRISSSDPNLLNIPARTELGKMIRQCFIARPGYKMVGGDFSNFELRIMANISLEESWVEAFHKGEDLHGKLCVRTFEVDESQMRSPFPYNPKITYRDVQKTIDFGLPYGMTEHKFSETTGMDLKTSKSVLKSFMSSVPKVTKMLDTFAATAMAYGNIRSSPPFGRIRWFPTHAEARKKQDYKELSSIARKAKNMPIQSTNADIIKATLIRLNSLYEMVSNGEFLELVTSDEAFILLSVYDEIQVEVKEDRADHHVEMLKLVMEDTGNKYITHVPVVADVAKSDYWKK